MGQSKTVQIIIFKLKIKINSLILIDPLRHLCI